MYKLETVIFTNGERFLLLINKETGLPDFYSTLWVTLELRYSAVNTIRNKLVTLQWLMEWENNNNLIIIDLIKNEKMLTESELESLFRHIQINAAKQKKTNYIKKRFFTKGRIQFIDSYPSVSLSHKYNRLTTFSEYILFLSKTIKISCEYRKNLMEMI